MATVLYGTHELDYDSIMEAYDNIKDNPNADGCILISGILPAEVPVKDIYRIVEGINNGTAETTTQVSTGTATIQNDKIVITYPFAPNIGYTHLRWNLNNAAYIDNDKYPLVGIYVRSISSAKRR